jgi:tetratricopeptide (TPR) repeat protein
MDEALQESGLPQSHEDFLYEPSSPMMEGISSSLSQDLHNNIDSQASLIQEMQDQLGMQFDPDADLQDPNGPRKKVDKRRGPKPRPRALTTVPERLAGVFGQANLAYTMADYPEAMRLLHQIIKEAPQSSQPWLQLALIHEELGNVSKAMHTYLVAAHLIVKDAELWRKIGTMSL